MSHTVPFYNIDTDTVIEMTLSEEDAVRAANGKSYFTYQDYFPKHLF